MVQIVCTELTPSGIKDVTIRYENHSKSRYTATILCGLQLQYSYSTVVLDTPTRQLKYDYYFNIQIITLRNFVSDVVSKHVPEIFEPAIYFICNRKYNILFYHSYVLAAVSTC